MKERTGRCQRCGKETNVHIMSMFDTALICLGCEERERRSPRYNKACEAENRAVLSGDFNFAGTGWKP